MMKIELKKTAEPEKTPQPVKITGFMPKHQKPDTDSSSKTSLAYLSYFLLLVGICVLIGLFARLIFTYQKSTFSTDAYSVLMNSKNPFIASYNSVLKKITYIKIESKVSQERVLTSVSTGFPIDGMVKVAIDITPDNFSKPINILKMLINQFKSKFYNLTIIDFAKLIMYSNSIPKSNVNIEKIRFDEGGNGVVGLTSDEVYDIFKDPDVIEEALSLEVVNSTSIQGLAGKVSQVLKNIGCNVISISTQPKESTSVILSTKKSKTAIRISHILGVPRLIVNNLNSTADVKIMLGNDFGRHKE